MNNSSSSAQSSLSSMTSLSVVGGSSSTSTAALALEDFQFPSDLVSIQDCKDKAQVVLKSELMAALSKEVKSLDEESWKYEAPRSRIHLMSRNGSFLPSRTETSKHGQSTSQK